VFRAQLEGPLQRIPKPLLHTQRPFVFRSAANFSYVHYEAGTLIVLYFISYVYPSQIVSASHWTPLQLDKLLYLKSIFRRSSEIGKMTY